MWAIRKLWYSLALSALVAGAIPHCAMGQAIRPRSLLQRNSQPAAVVIQAEQLASGAKASAGNVQSQAMQAFGNSWQGNAQLFWQATKSGDRLELSLRVKQAGQYSLAGRFTKAPDYGSIQIGLQGRQLANYDGFEHRGVVLSGSVPLGNVQLQAGDNWLIIVVSGKHPRSRGYFVGIDSFELTPLNAVARPGTAAARPQRGGSVVPKPPAPGKRPAIGSTRPGKRATPSVDGALRDPSSTIDIRSPSDRRTLSDQTDTLTQPAIRDGRIMIAGVVIPRWDRRIPQPSDGRKVRFVPLTLPPELKIWNGQGGEFEFYQDHVYVTTDVTDLVWRLRWTRPPAKTTHAVWQVTQWEPPTTSTNWEKPPGLFASGELSEIPGSGEKSWFEIDFGTVVVRLAADSTGQRSASVPAPSGLEPAGRRRASALLSPKNLTLPNTSPQKQQQPLNLAPQQLPVRPALLHLSQMASRMTQVVFVRLVCVDASGKAVGSPSNAVRFVYGPPEPNDLTIYDPKDLQLPEHKDLLAPVVKIVEYAPIRYQAEDAHRRYVVTRDIPFINWKKGKKVYLKPKDDDDNILEQIGSAFGDVVDFFEDAINWVATAYEDIKSTAVDFVADDILNCGDPCRTVLSTGLDYGLTAVGLPPDIPNFDELIEMGKGNLAEMIAAEAQNAGIPVTEEMAKKLIDEVARQATEIANHGTGGNQFLRPDPDYQYRPAFVRITVHNLPQAGQRDAGLSLYAWYVFRHVYLPLPRMKAGETREVTLFLKPDVEYWEAKHIREHGGAAWDTSARQSEWFEMYHDGEMDMAVQVTARPLGETNVLERPPAYGSTGYYSIKHPPVHPYVGQ